jgi:DNA repair protein RAD16
MARGRPSTRGTPKTSSTTDVSREPSIASGRMTRSAATRSQAASSTSTPAPEVQAASGSRPRGRPRKSVAAVDASPSVQSPAPDVVPARRRGRPSKIPAAESESVSSVPTPKDGDSESDYSTPASSKVPTPAAGGNIKIEVVIPAPSTSLAPDRERELRNSAYSMKARGKGKSRMIADSDEDDDDLLDDSRDAQVARRLQQEEFKKPPTIPSPTLPFRRSGRSSLSTTMPAQTSVKRERALTDTAAKRGRPPKKQRVVPDSDDQDIDMDAEIAAAAVLDSDDLSSLSSFGDEEFSENNGSDEDGGEYVSSDDEPLRSRKSKGKLPARTVATAASRGNGVATTVPPSDTTTALDQGPSGDELDALENGLEWVEPSGSDNITSAIDTGTSDTDGDDTRANVADISRSRRGFRSVPGRRGRLVRERERLEKNHPEIITLWRDLEDRAVVKAGKAVQPQNISRQLKRPLSHR